MVWKGWCGRGGVEGVVWKGWCRRGGMEGVVWKGWCGRVSYNAGDTAGFFECDTGTF